MVSLILFRGLQGIGAGGVQATVNTLAGDLYELSERGRVQGWLSSVWGISAVIGPALGGSLARYASWRWIFLINLPVGAAAIGLLVRYLHENVQRTRHRIDVAAGGVLAAMSIGWPLASSQSARLFLRVGFRDTQLVGAGICLVAVGAFLLAPEPAPVWQPAVETFVLGAGLGLLSVASIVGPQSIVGWGQRGVVTGTVMFCRYLGQSLGAAIFGAIFNAALSGKLHGAPAALRPRLPGQVSGVAAALARPGALGPAAGDYLRAAIATATSHVYAALTVVAALTIAGALLIMPRRFSTTAGESTSTGPAQKTE
jgi:MFS family permease